MRIHVLLRREGWQINHKRTYRIYCEEGLHLRAKRPRKRVAASPRVGRVEITGLNECWSMDFVSDTLFDGRRYRALTIVDNFSRECLGIKADQSIKGHHVGHCWSGSVSIVVRPKRSEWTTVLNSFRRLWINGPMRTG
jgi:putative transposase